MWAARHAPGAKEAAIMEIAGSREKYLDGLRGLAAMQVVFQHYTWRSRPFRSRVSGFWRTAISRCSFFL
jgi:peptidoglycan/LPS O-acetylase OafA/YrhL